MRRTGGENIDEERKICNDTIIQLKNGKKITHCKYQREHVLSSRGSMLFYTKTPYASLILPCTSSSSEKRR